MKMYKCLSIQALDKNTNEVESQTKVTNGACNKCYHALGHLLEKRYAALPW